MTSLKDSRPEPAHVGSERETLEGFLEFHRATLLWKCEGLTHEQLALRSTPPSVMSLLGLVRHLTEVEGGWFLDFVGRAPEPVYWVGGDYDNDFTGVDGADTEAAFALYRERVQQCREAVAGVDLDATYTDDRDRTFSLRWVYNHMIEEYARHNGHADLLREAIDGAVGE